MYRTICKLTAKDRMEIAKKISSYGLLDCYGIHKFIYTLFPEKLGAEFSYNAENEKRNGDIIIVIQSDIEPVLDGFESYDITILNVKSLTGRKRFCLSVNSTKKSFQTKHYSPVSEQEFSTWLAKRAEDNGFKIELDSLRIDKRYTKSFIGKEHEDRKLYVTACSGVMEVIDEKKFQKAATAGVGRGKAYGLGMVLFS